MASLVATEKLFSCCKIEQFDHDPGVSTPLVTSPDGGTTLRVADLRDYAGFAVVAMSSALTGAGINLLEIVAFTDAAGTANTTVIKSSGAVVCDAVGDYVVEECTAEEIAELGRASGLALRYVAARLTLANAADEANVVYIRHGARFPATGLTADTIS